MVTQNKDKFFFFYDDCSSIDILPGSLEHGYLCVLNEDLYSATKIFNSIDSPRAIWGNILVSILRGYIDVFPTYFQIRNFFEIDLDLLLKNNKLEYIELLLGSTKLLSTLNQETYKYVARVMFVNGLNSACFSYLNKAKEIFYNDPELLFLFGLYYIKIKDMHKALFYINKCLKILPSYYPALEIKQKFAGVDF